MNGLDKVEQNLIDLGVSYQEIAERTWLLDDSNRGLARMAVSVADEIVFFRTKVMDAPKTKRLEFFEALLRLNAEDLVHGAYGLDDEEVVLTDTLEHATMDKAEFEAVLDAFGVALSQHYPVLGKYRD